MGLGLLIVLLALAEYSVCRDVDASCVLLRLQGSDSDILRSISLTNLGTFLGTLCGQPLAVLISLGCRVIST